MTCAHTSSSLIDWRDTLSCPRLSKLKSVYAGAKKRKQEGIEESPRPVAAPRTVAMPSTQRHTPAATAQRSPAATNAQRSTPVAVAQPAAPAPQSRHASEEAQEQPHVQFPDDSPDAKQGTI